MEISKMTQRAQGEEIKRIPIARCPNCGQTVLYSDDPRDELTVTVRSDCYGMDYEFEDIGSFCDKNKSEMVAL